MLILVLSRLLTFSLLVLAGEDRVEVVREDVDRVLMLREDEVITGLQLGPMLSKRRMMLRLLMSLQVQFLFVVMMCVH